MHKLFINLQTIEERAALEEELTRLRRTLDSQRSAAADAAALAANAAAAAAEDVRSVRYTLL
jgi:aspartate/glutamate racemase